MMELGLLEGEKVFIKNFAPFGGPLEVFVKGYNLCLGKAEAERVVLKC